MKIKNIFWFGLIIILAIALFYFLQHKNEQEVIKIGATTFLTGSLSNIGKAIQNGIELAVEEVNNSGGIKGEKINLILEDEGDNAQKAVSAINKLINIDKVKVIIGPMSSTSVMAAAPIAEQNKVILLSPGAASPNITYAGDYIFRNRASGSLEGREIANFGFNQLALRRIIIFAINQDYGVGFSDVFKSTFSSLGGNIVTIDWYNQGETNFKTQLLKFKRYNFDGIYIIGVPNEVGIILKQIKELGIRTKILMNNMENPVLLETAGDAAEGIYFPIPFFDPNSTDEKVKLFVKSYESKYGSAPDLFAANAYDAVYIIKTAIEEVGYDSQAIKDYLYSVKNLRVVSGGKISFDQNGDVIKKLVIKTVKDGKFIIYGNL